MTIEDAIEIIKSRNFYCIECIDRNEECCKALDMAIKALQENDKLKAQVKKWRLKAEEQIDLWEEDLAENSSEKTAEWLHFDCYLPYGEGGVFYKCSNCRNTSDKFDAFFHYNPDLKIKLPKYCPNCGAKMGGAER